ncbi:MAG: ATP-binding protein [Deinococcales bacterium]
MRLRTQLMLVVTLVALAAVTITALLSVQVATRRVGRLLDMPVTTQDASHTPAARGTGPGMMGGSGATPAGAGPAFAEARRQALRSDLWRANLQAAGIALLVAAAVAAALSARLSGPLRNLTAVTNRYAAGERAARAREGGRNEVAEVAQAFNRMADSLQREEDEQQRLIADIAHELRTPLTVLKGELEALEDGLLEAEPATYRRLGEEVTLLERLVQDLRLLTMAESGELTLHRRPVDLAVLVREVTASFAPHAGQEGVTFATELSPATVNADPDRLRQVLGNLLDNAARHAPPGSRVDVTLHTASGSAELGVRDRGPGIPEEERERVFQRFYRLDRARSRATGGSGLGLAIVRTLVELHEGSVAAASHPEGGALLVVRLPLSA